MNQLTTASETHSIRVEGELWEPGEFWTAALAHLAKRFARVKPLDTATFADVAGEPAQRVATDVALLTTWGADDIDWRRELGRYFDEHAPLFVRPNSTTNRALRQRAANTPIEFVSALPRQPLESLLRHLGVLRLATTVTPESVTH